MTEENADLWNGRPNWLSKLSYKYISNARGRDFDELPCSESFDNTSTPALRTDDSLSLRKVMISGMDRLSKLGYKYINEGPSG